MSGVGDLLETGRVALIRYSSSDGIACVGSGLLIDGSRVLTADHVADGTEHLVECSSGTHKVLSVLRSGMPQVDLAVLTIRNPSKGLGRLECARIDRSRVDQVDGCVAVGFPRWRKDGSQRRSAQVSGRVPTAEGLEPRADSGLRAGLLTLVASRIPGAPNIPTGLLTDTQPNPWGGMSGAGVVVGSLLIGVVRSHNRAAGGQSLTITPLTAIDQLPLALRNQFWDALGIEDSDLLRTLPDSEAGVDGRMDSGRLVRVGKPPMRADCFQARSAGAVLARVVADGQTAILTEEATLGYATQVLSGMGGVGKTQVAAGYARSVWADPALAVAAWVTVHSRAAIISDYAKLANQVIGADLRDPEQSASEFLSWLQTAKRRWLIVLDDIHDFADITGLWPPNTATGQVVVTTRNRGAGLIRRDRVFINVAVFTSIESTNYIREKFKEHPHLIADDIAVAELAADLGYLPLALAQATAYMLNRSLTVQEYRRRLVDQRKKLTQLFPEKGELPDDQSRTIKATWSMSVDLANRLMPTGMARPLLEVASLLDPGGIPASLFTSESIRNYMTARLDQSVDPEDIHDGLHILHRLSLATFDTTERHATIQVHSLVQRATRDTLTKS